MSNQTGLLMADQMELRIKEQELLEAEEEHRDAKAAKKLVDPKDATAVAAADAKVLYAGTTISNLRRDIRAAIKTATQNYIDHINQQKAAPAPIVPTAPIIQPAPQPIVQEVTIVDPSKFKGDVKDYSRFIFEVKNVISVRTRMDTDIKRIVYVGSLLEESASTWYQLWVEDNSTGGVVVATYAAFMTAFETVFKDPLEQSKYRAAVL